MAWDNTSWGGQSSPKSSISKIQGNLDYLYNSLGGSSDIIADAKAYTDNKIATTIGTAPAMLDTLQELANAIDNDPSFAATMTALIGTKAPLVSPTFSGNVVLPQTTNIGTTTAAELGYLHGVTSSIQTQLNTKVSTGFGIGENLTGTNTDPNSVDATSFTYTGANSHNPISVQDGLCMNVSYNNDYKSQMFVILNEDGTGDKPNAYLRNKYAGTWRPYRKFAFTDNLALTGAVTIGIVPTRGQSLTVDSGVMLVTPGKDIADSTAGIWITPTGGTTYQGFNWQMGTDYSANMYVGDGVAWRKRLSVIPNGNLNFTGGRICIPSNAGIAAPSTTGVSLNSMYGFEYLESNGANGLRINSFGSIGTLINPDISGGGKCAVGHSSPQAVLDIAGGGVVASSLNVETKSNTLFTTANPNVKLGIGYTEASDSPYIQAINSYAHTANSLCINPFGGSVGFGTTTPIPYSAITASSVLPNGDYGAINIVNPSNHNYRMFMSLTDENKGIIGCVQSGSVWLPVCINPNGGNIGVGVLNPQATLHSKGSTIVGIDPGGIGGSQIGNLQMCIAMDTNGTLYLTARDASGNTRTFQFTAPAPNGSRTI